MNVPHQHANSTSPFQKSGYGPALFSSLWLYTGGKFKFLAAIGDHRKGPFLQASAG